MLYQKILLKVDLDSMQNTVFYLARPSDLPKNPNELCLELSDLKELLVNAYKYAEHPNKALKNIQDLFAFIDLSSSFFEKISDDSDESQQNKDNDLAFNIHRVKGDILKIVSHSTLNAYTRLLTEADVVGTNLHKNDWGKLHCAYRVIFNLLSNINHSTYQIIPSDPKKSIDSSKESGLNRWEQGHYVFMTIIQGMIISLNFFTYHFNNTSNEESINYYMHATAMLMWGSEAALKFAADFSNSAYDLEVRPTLSPPIAPPGMSGLYWRDHEFFIKKIIFKLKPIFSNPPHFLKETVNSFQEALACVYDAHKLVCTKFVGQSESSLISKKPAGIVLQNYKKNRLHVFNP